MLRCLFGKCSSETYVVNPFPTDRGKQNGTLPPTTPLPEARETEILEKKYNGNDASHKEHLENNKTDHIEHNNVIVPQVPQQSIVNEKIGTENKLSSSESNKQDPTTNVIDQDKKELSETIDTGNKVLRPEFDKKDEFIIKGEGQDIRENSSESNKEDELILKETDQVKKENRQIYAEDKVSSSESNKDTRIFEERDQGKSENSEIIYAEDKLLSSECNKKDEPILKETDQDKKENSRQNAEDKVSSSESNKNTRIFEETNQGKNESGERIYAEDKLLSSESNKKNELIQKGTDQDKKKNNEKSDTEDALISNKQVDPTLKGTDQDKTKKAGNSVKIVDAHVASAPQDEDIKIEIDTEPTGPEEVHNDRRRSGVPLVPVKYEETKDNVLPHYPKDPDDEVLIKSAIEKNDFLNKIISGKRLDDVINAMYNKEIASKETIVKQGEKGSHMYISAKGKYQVVVKGKVEGEFDDVRVFGELAILYNAKRLATIKALTPGRVWVLDRPIYQQIMLRYNIKEQDEIMAFLMKNQKLNVVGKDVLQEVANLLKPEFFLPGKHIVRQGDKGLKFYIIRAGTVTITKEGEGIVGTYEKGDCFGELALIKEDCRQATVTANAPGVECLTLTRKEFIDYFGDVDDITKLKPRPQNSIKDAVTEHADVNLLDLKIIKTLGVGGFGRVELVQHRKKKDLVFALKYLKKIDIVLQHQQDHVYNERDIQMSSKSPFIIRLYRTYKDNKYIYFLMESCLGGDLWSLLQKQKLRRFEEKDARFIASCVLEAFDYLHSRGIVYRDLKPENLLIASNGYIKLTDFGFAKKISARGRTYTFAGTPEYVAPEIVLNKGHDRAVDYWAFGAFIFELLTGRTPFRTDDSSHMKTYNKILNGIDNVQFPNYVNLKARNIVEKLCRPIPTERLGMQQGGIKDIKAHKWFSGWDWQKFSRCEISPPFKPKLKSLIDTQYFDSFKKDTDIPPEELSGWDQNF